MIPFAEIESKLLSGFRAPLVALAIAMIVGYFLTPWVRSFAIKRGAVDDPTRDDRRVHTQPTPRWGGLAIYGGLVASLGILLPFAYPQTVAFPPYLIGMLILGAVIVVVGALDDLYQYRASIQALFLLACGIVIQFFGSDAGYVQIQTLGQSLKLGWLAMPFTAIYIFVVTKTLDTIDGLDGLAAGIAAIAGGTLAIIAIYSGQPRVALIAAAVTGSVLGFLRHNYNPAKIFLGTGGAQLLGFTLACVSIVGAMKTAATVAVAIPLLIFGVPIFDATFVVIRRILARQAITQADKRHLHHTLLGQGLTQRQVVWVLYAAAMLLAASLMLVIKQYG